MNNVVEFMTQQKLVVIYRGFTPEQCVEVTRVLYDAGIRLFEVTLNSENAYESIALLNQEFTEASIGAGTVLTVDEVDQAAAAGAKYIISPNMNLDVIKHTKAKGLISIPGTFTPSEAQAAVEAGADVVKVFPINVLGVNYLKQVQAPLDNILFMPSGGINAELAAQLFDAGAAAIGFGAQILGKEAIESKDWGTVTSNVKKFIQAAGL